MRQEKLSAVMLPNIFGPFDHSEARYLFLFVQNEYTLMSSWDLSLGLPRRIGALVYGFFGVCLIFGSKGL